MKHSFSAYRIANVRAPGFTACAHHGAIALLCMAVITPAGFGGTVITENLPPNTVIVNIDARADGSAASNGDQSLWYQPFNTASQLLTCSLAAGTYAFRVIDSADAGQRFSALRADQLSQIWTAWTFNSPWVTDYLVFGGDAATSTSAPQLFDGAFSNTNGNWFFFANAADAYQDAVSKGYASFIRTAASGGRDSTNTITAFTFSTATNLIFAIPDNVLNDNSGGVSVLIAPAAPKLAIESISGAAVRLLWPTNGSGFSLQYNPLLASSGWLPATPAPTIIGTNNVVTNNLGGGSRFYRLEGPAGE